MKPSCATASCHGPAAAVAGLDFSTEDRGYTSLTGLWIWIVDPTGSLQDGCQISHDTIVCPRQRRPLVVPFDPAQSRLVHMLRAEGAPRMPPDRPLPEADIRLVETWIANGAAQGRADIPPATPLGDAAVVGDDDGGADARGDGHGPG